MKNKNHEACVYRPLLPPYIVKVYRIVRHQADQSLKGKKIAVKVQYPGIAESIKSDVQMLRNILRITPFSWIIDGALTEIEEGLAEELDYRLEADNTDFFYNNLCMDNIIIPEVYREYSSERVLATSFIDGEKLDGWLYRSPDRDKRSYYGQLLCDLFISSIKGNFLIHADPNIGNFLFRDDGRLGLIDFGCVKKLSPDFIDKGNFNNAEELFRLSGIKCKKSETDRESYKFFTSWIDLIGDATIADAICDRLLHTSHKIDIGGPSMRKEKAKNSGRNLPPE